MPNKLQYETSPYLLQHAHNPVDWYPWGEEAFDKAKAEHKPVLVSIGYSACHWCHVMERESFEDSGVAAFMNRHFINIKVDREEHPDVDHMYMDALQATTGSGGWPLNMFVTPDRKPFYGGTYFPPEKMYNRASWMDVLQAIQQSWEFKKDEIELQAQQMVQHLQQSSLIAKDASGILVKEMPDAIATQLMKQADENYGGFGQAPKFPSTMGIIYLLQHYHFAKNEASLKHALFSLDAMINGGIYDQIGGGFARYTTDSHWLVPHFEKMLYDNALLISAMSHAYRITRQERYRRAIEETITFCNRELSDGKGFYGALDADSEGVEGKYYTWTWQEWKQALPGIHPAVEEYLNVTPSGNWEGTNILNCPVGEQYILDKYNLERDEWLTMLADARKRLFKTRSKRIRPGTDDKMLLSWNALMNMALVDAATALDRNDYLLQADAHMEWMLDTFRMNPSGLFHVAKNGEAKIAGKLDDYAFIVKALFHLASGIGNTDYLKIAAELMEYTMLHFSDEENRFFYFSSDMQNDIPVRKTEIYDGALPSANSVMMENLYLAGSLSEDISYMKRCEQMLRDMAQVTSRYPLSFSNWAIFLQKHINGIKQLIIAGSNANEMIRDWCRHYFPEIYSFSCDKATTSPGAFQGKFNPGYDYLYLCEQFACQQPVSDIKALIKAIKF